MPTFSNDFMFDVFWLRLGVLFRTITVRAMILNYNFLRNWNNHYGSFLDFEILFIANLRSKCFEWRKICKLCHFTTKICLQKWINNVDLILLHSKFWVQIFSGHVTCLCATTVMGFEVRKCIKNSIHNGYAIL